MSRQEIMATDYGEFMDMIACLQIYEGNAVQKKIWTYDEVIALR